ncbi:coproporphyrinogen dehydrogenase HemZ [Candidatus Merdisoma sp. JLR.KK006]|uniref:coproporphyrinogen dehydrogenase HemZ n=1 Tax=Candidatus Merdisoma sp. JLR.KK006 TaxID=3112626 RepID=UPI002FF37D1C
MIEVKVNQESFAYDIHSLIKAFYPEEEVNVREKETFTEDTFLQIAVDVRDEEIEFALYENQALQKKSRVCVKNPERKLVKNQLKQLIYSVLSDYTGRTLPWGTLTGIRPVKIPMAMLEQGSSNVEIADYMRSTYLCSNEKTALAISIANREREVLKGLDYQDGYSLYVGIPFCPSICLYCSFSSSPLKLWEKQVENYLEALFSELRFIGKAYKGRKLNTIYVGGGTPTTLTASQLECLLGVLEECFDYGYLKELTVEAGRPDSVTLEKFQVLKAHGVTRVSVNPQTMNQETLCLIGRKHTVEQTKEAFYLAREAGFDNINMDLIVGLPGEELPQVQHTLEELRILKPDSITVHSLAVKRAARLRLFQDEYREMGLKNSQEIMDLAYLSCAEQQLYPYYLYRQKNMAGNFENVGYAKVDKAGIYNILIMEEKQTILAAGAGAASKFVLNADHIERVENVKDVAQYISRIEEMIERKRSFLLRCGTGI